jgi:ABC-2 type transport system ATP-binding protein
VAALCQRVVIITQGQIRYDGSLSGIIDRFSGQKLVTLHLADDAPVAGLERFGQVVEVQLPKVKIRIDRGQVAKALAAILAQHAIEDIAVEDPPLEEVIADLFSQVQQESAAEPEPVAAE